MILSQDSNLVSDWQPLRNLRNANSLIEKIRQRIQTQEKIENTSIIDSNQVEQVEREFVFEISYK